MKKLDYHWIEQLNKYFSKKKSIVFYLFSFPVTSFLLLLFIGGMIMENINVRDNEVTAEELTETLLNEFELWYPLVLDSTYGGYFSDLNYKWELEGTQNKMIVSQARHLWSASNGINNYNNKDLLLKTASHGFTFLLNKMWDKEYGGFYQMVDRKGNVLNDSEDIIKTAYGNAFAIYGLAAYYNVSGESEALEAAKNTFYWLEKNSFDPEYGGYFQFISSKSKPYVEGFNGFPPKDQNSSIHLLEAFTELYKVWPDSLLKERLYLMLKIIRDKIATEKGYMNLFFKKDWTPVVFNDSTKEIREKNYEIDHVSFGHDIETAYLLIEASETLGSDEEITLVKAKKMVDHTIKYGWDKDNGGIFDRGYYTSENKVEIIKNTKEWWGQFEAMNSLLIMSKFFPEDSTKYLEKFHLQWDYIKNYLLDKKHGGWFWGGIDIEPDNKFSPKGTIWKVNYHTSRSLINCIKKINHYK